MPTLTLSAALWRQIAFLCASGFLSGSVSAQSDETISDILTGVLTDSENDLSIQLASPTDTLTVGETISYELASGFDGYCYVLHVDARDRATLMKPRGCGDENSEDGMAAVFPTEGELTADFPIGTDSVYGILSPVPFPVLDSLLGQSPLTSLTVADASLVVQDIARAAQADEVSIAMLSYDVVEAEAETQFTTRGIIRKVVAGMDAPSTSGEYASFDVDSIHFDFASDELTPQSKKQLSVFGAALGSKELNGARLKVAGHTDDVGDEAYNESLSMRRAEAVRAFLVSEFALDPRRLESIGYGETAPVVSNSDDEARALNRRVEMVFLADEG